MKKLLLIVLSLVLIFNVPTVYAAGDIALDEVAEKMNYSLDYDEKTDSVFLNGIYTEAVKGKAATLYFNGFSCGEGLLTKRGDKYFIKESDLKEKLGLVYNADGSFTRLEKNIPQVQISPDKTYAIVNCQSGKALTSVDNELYTEAFTQAENQKFTFVQSDVQGFYHIRVVATGKNIDIYNHGMAAGVEIIVWDPGNGDNQKFSVEYMGDGYYITARGRKLPMDEYGSEIIQNSIHNGNSQKWKIIEIG